MKSTNECKADIFFKAATEYLDLILSDSTTNGYVKQTRPVAKGTHSIRAYICDAVRDAHWNTPDCYIQIGAIHEEMRAFGMPEKNFGVWDHIPAEERQEARWFFLMLMVEYLDDADNE